MSRHVIDLQSFALDELGRVVLTDSSVDLIECEPFVLSAGANGSCTNGSNGFSCYNGLCSGSSNYGSCTNATQCINSSNSTSCR